MASPLALRQPGELVQVQAILPKNLPVFRIGLKFLFEEGRALARSAHPKT